MFSFGGYVAIHLNKLFQSKNKHIQRVSIAVLSVYVIISVLLPEVDYKKYGFDMINYGSNLANKSKEEILYNDFKKYSTNSGKIGLGQIYSTDISNIKKELSEYIDMLNKVKKDGDYVFVCLFITDIIKNGTYVIYSDGAKNILDSAFSDNISECYFFPQILSRKLQVLPSILNVMNS